MPRIKEQTNVTLTREAVAPRIQINWNPVDNSGAVIFHVERMEAIDGEFQRMIPEGFLSVSLADLMPRSVTLPDGSEVSTPMVMGYIKAMFDTLYTEREVAVSEPPPDDSNGPIQEPIA